MTQPPTSDFSTVVEIVADVGVCVLGDPQAWVAALQHVQGGDPRRLQWPRPGPRRDYRGLINLAFEGYVAQCLVALAQIEVAPPVDQGDDEFQMVLMVSQWAIERLDAQLVRWAKDARLIKRVSGIRDFRNWMCSEAAAAAVTASNQRGQRAAALALTGISSSAAYRALRRKPKPDPAP